MYHTANLLVCFVYFHMRGSIGRRIVSALHLIALQIYQYHIIRSQLIVIYPAGLNREDAALPVDLTDISPCKSDQAIFGKKHIRFVDPLF